MSRSILVLLSASVLFISMIFYGQNLAQMSEPKKCLTRFSLIYRSILSLLSGWLSSGSVSLISETFYGLSLARVSPRVFVRDLQWACSRLYLVLLDMFITRGGDLHRNAKNYRESKKWKFWRVMFKIVVFNDGWFSFAPRARAGARLWSIPFASWNSKSARIWRFWTLTEFFWSGG